MWGPGWGDVTKKIYDPHEKTGQWESGRICHSTTSPSSYIAESESGSIHRRNRQFIRSAKRDSILEDRHDQPPITDANTSQKEPHTNVNVPSPHRTLQSESSTHPCQRIIPEERTPSVLVKQPTTESHTSRPIPEPRRSRHCINTPQRLDF